MSVGGLAISRRKTGHTHRPTHRRSSIMLWAAWFNYCHHDCRAVNANINQPHRQYGMVAVFQKTLESRVQHLKKRNHLVMQLLIIQLPGKSVWVRQGHQHQTYLAQKCGYKKLCNWELCVMSINTDNIREFWGQNFYRHSTNLIFFVTFYVFWNVILKKCKKSRFFKSEKKRKIRILEHCMGGARRTH